MSRHFAKGVESSSDYLLRKKCHMFSPPCSILDATTSFCCEQKEKEPCKKVLYPYGNYISGSGMQPCRYKQTKPRNHVHTNLSPCSTSPCSTCGPLYQKSHTITICTNPLLDICNLCNK